MRDVSGHFRGYACPHALGDAGLKGPEDDCAGAVRGDSRHLGHGQLAAIAVREGDQLLALLPLAVVGEDAQRRLAWVGAGISDYLTALVDDARADEAWPHVERGLRELVAEIGRARLENVPEGDPLLGRLSSPHQPWRHRRSEDAICL